MSCPYATAYIVRRERVDHHFYGATMVATVPNVSVEVVAITATHLGPRYVAFMLHGAADI